MKDKLLLLVSLGVLVTLITAGCGGQPTTTVETETSVRATATLTEAPPTETQATPTPTEMKTPPTEIMPATKTATDYEFTDQGVKFTVDTEEDFIAEHQDWCPDPAPIAGGTWVHFPPQKGYVLIEFPNGDFKVYPNGQVKGTDYVLQAGWLVGFVSEDRTMAAQALYCGEETGIFLRVTFG